MGMGEMRSTSLKIALATFAILALELALIRWTSQQVRVFAYFNNLTLIATFLGMGLGVALGGKRTRLQHWTLPALLLLSPRCRPAAASNIGSLLDPDREKVLEGLDPRGVRHAGLGSAGRRRGGERRLAVRDRRWQRHDLAGHLSRERSIPLIQRSAIRHSRRRRPARFEIVPAVGDTI